jgi:formate hydrogenlyase subunit 3/multisubunit Na+/H+ antiporter MnhD subunit
MSKDQAIGGAIFIVCIVVAIGYLVTLFYPNWLSMVGLAANPPTEASLQNIRFWVIAIPVFIAFVAIMFIGAWIGWTMATTPPPKPIEEITSEIEEKKEEAEEAVKSAVEDEKMPEKKRKT